jgi:uncharacterized membrane protein
VLLVPSCRGRADLDAIVTGAAPGDDRSMAGVGVDALAVVVFVIIGRRSHDEGSALGGIAAVSAPFLLALGIAWIAGWPLRQSAADVRFGIYVWVVTAVLGLLARRFAFARSTAASFIVVASIVLAVFIVGWRAAVAAVVARRRV